MLTAHHDILAFDTETYLIADGRKVPRLVCMTVAGSGTVPNWLQGHRSLTYTYDGLPWWGVLLTRLDAPKAFRSMLREECYGLVGQFTAYDLLVMHRAAWEVLDLDLMADTMDAIEDGRVYDTSIRQKLLNFNDGDYYSKTRLSDLVHEHLDIDISATKGQDTWRTRYAELDGVPAEEWPVEAFDYAVMDAIYTLLVAHKQSKPKTSAAGTILVVADGSITNEGQQVAADLALQLCGAWGVRTDREAVDQFVAKTEAAVAEGEAVGQAGGWVRPNGTKDVKALQARVTAAYEAQGRPVPTTAKGNVKTDTKRTIPESKDPELLAWAESSADRTNLQRYAPQLLRGLDHAMTSSPRVLVATGRCSWSNPNQHNPPRKGGYRECFVARPGMVYGAADWSAAELRALGQIHLIWFGTSALVDAFNEGKDPHLILGAQLLRVSYDEAVARYQAGDPEVKDARQRAKAGNFGFPGGMGVATFASTYGDALISDEDKQGKTRQEVEAMVYARSEELRQTWLRTWPEQTLYFERIAAATKHGDFAAIQFGSGRVRGGCGYSDGANTYFQGLIADVSKFALWLVTKECYLGIDALGDLDGEPTPLYGVRPWLLLHDEILAEGPEETAHLWVERMAHIMRLAMSTYMPDVPAVCEPALMRRWYKGAEPVYDDQGKLIPWEPPTTTH